MFVVILALSGAVAAFATDPYFLFSPKGVAKLEIRMLNGKNFWDIGVSQGGDFQNGNFIAHEAEKLEANMWIRNSDPQGLTNTKNSTYTSGELVSAGVKIRIRGRGNTSFHNEKRAYSIELVNAAGEEVKKPLLGMGSHDEWALMSMWNDRSMFRIPLAFWLGQKMTGIDYTPQLRFVEVIVVNADGSTDYRGLFVLSEKANRGDDRVDLKKLTDDAADQVEPRVSGGYMIEVVPNDKMKNQAEWDKCFLIPGAEDDTYHHYVFNYPNSKNITNAQRNYMIDYMQDVFDAVYGENSTDTINGYLKYIDENSFIDWCILHDLSKGTDNRFHASIFMQKDRGKKLRMTCPWDFDLSFGNVEEGNGCYYEDGWHMSESRYFSKLWEDPRFYKKLKDRYDSLMPLFDLVPYVLQENYKFLDSLGVWDREFARYGEKNLNDFQYSNDVKTRKGHVRYLTEWFESRKVWLYYNLGETAKERCDRMQEVRPIMRVMQPENLLNCNGETFTLTNTEFMRKIKDNENVYKYNLIKPTNTDNNYADYKYQIKRKDGEYRIEVIDESGCTSIPSLPVELCQDRTYAKPQIPTIPDLAPQPNTPKPPTPPDPTAVASTNANEIIIFPNPAHDYVFINADENVFVELFDIKGVKLKETREDYLNVSDISQGIYFVRLTGAKNTIVRKLVIY
ncbi:MAG: CotH kinase family protein [Prevotellaceae bacterium]|nr:CotH kinase family protein [Prevotellaceae bacterium]